MSMKHILIVDDDSAIQHLFEQFLQSRGFSTALADDGFTAVLSMERHAPDLIITDIIMDGMDGLALIREVRKSKPLIPVIAISGGQCVLSVDFEQRAEKSGATEFMEKPVGLKELLQSIQTLLGASPPAD